MSRPALDVIAAGHQATTLQWREQPRSRFELVISPFVLDEASEGDRVAAEKRLAAMSGISVLSIAEPRKSGENCWPKQVTNWRHPWRKPDGGQSREGA